MNELDTLKARVAALEAEKADILKVVTDLSQEKTGLSREMLVGANVLTAAQMIAEPKSFYRALLYSTGRATREQYHVVECYRTTEKTFDSNVKNHCYRMPGTNRIWHSRSCRLMKLLELFGGDEERARQSALAHDFVMELFAQEPARAAGLKLSWKGYVRDPRNEVTVGTNEELTGARRLASVAAATAVAGTEVGALLETFAPGVMDQLQSMMVGLEQSEREMEEQERVFEDAMASTSLPHYTSQGGPLAAGVACPYCGARGPDEHIPGCITRSAR